MSSQKRTSRTGSRGVVALVGVLAWVLVGCSSSVDAPGGSEGPQGDPGASGSASDISASPSPSLPVPEGVDLTEEGTELSVGETATVAYTVRQGVVGVLDIKVTRLEKTTLKQSFEGWNLSAADKESAPYFVRAEVTNRGETDLGGQRVPLFIVDGDNNLVEATSFASRFDPCNPGTMPRRFKPGKSAEVCLVYLAPQDGKLTAVSFRPTQEVNPITWTGELKKPKPPGRPTKGKPSKAR